ncbi:MAG: iron-sulfur cluster insertion protein ErpA [Acidobacteria bacterium]|nr:iron-sulfur cluster insertion protein ErpA [Acidobacteriota bacterium]MCA1612407.1 iron-sulfur cluster insertion protein ErpA [Acidobacteriota bacterium]
MSSTLEKPLTPMTAPGDATKPLLSLTDAAVAKVKFFAESMPDSQNKPLRVFVQGGGCSGFQYGFTFDEKKENDAVLEQGGITVVVDPQSAIYLKDATVNYVEDFRGAGFSVENPNATGGCGCGKSFNA